MNAIVKRAFMLAISKRFIAHDPTTQRFVNGWLTAAGLCLVCAAAITIWLCEYSSAWQDGSRAYYQGNYQKAIPLLRKVLVLAPDFVQVHSLLGYSLLQTGHASAATREYRVLMRNDQANDDDVYNYGQALYQLGLLSAADIQWQNALAEAEKQNDNEIIMASKNALARHSPSSLPRAARNHERQ